MLSRALRSAVLYRAFSGGSDPYWLHLHEQPDKYAKYAHLHWHTVDQLEIGKYAKLRSKSEFGSHVTEDPANVEWFPELGDYKNMDKDSRDTVYENYMRWENEFQPFLENNIDYAQEGDHKLIKGAREAMLSVLKPKQIQEATALAKKLVEEYKAAGVPVTRNAVQTKVNLFLLKSLSKHQAHELKHAMLMYLDFFGCGLPFNED